MSRLVFLMHDPWLALCLVTARPGTPVVTWGGPEDAARFEELGTEALVLPPPDELMTLRLLEQEPVQRFLAATPSYLLTFKPSGRLETAAAALGASIALAPARLALGLENKLQLATLALEAQVPFPQQGKETVRSPDDYQRLLETYGHGFVVQSPRGFAGRRTWRVQSASDWQELVERLPGRPVRVARYVEGRPGTVNAVVDSAGSVLVTAAVSQVTGEPWLTGEPLGSCGNDFTWRAPSGAPDAPGATRSPARRGPEALAEQLGPVLAACGYRGHFGVDFVVDEEGQACLIEINPRLTASFALYAAWRPLLLDAHLDALAGRSISPARLAPLQGGQLIVRNQGDAVAPRLRESTPVLPGELHLGQSTVWPHPATSVQPGDTVGRWVGRVPVVDERGAVCLEWRPGTGGRSDSPDLT